MTQKVINILLVVMLFASCTGNRKYNDLMQQADSMMNIDDDSAKVAIQMLDGAKSWLPDFSKAQRMRYELLYHKAMNKADVPFSSDSVMREVVAYYDRHGSANDRMQAYYVLGCVYRDMHEAPTALEYYEKATEQADTTSKDCDYATLFRVYSQMGVLFDKQYLPYQELKAFGMAEKYAYLAKDTLKAIINFQYMGGAYSYLNKLDSAMLINLQAAKLFKKHGYGIEAAIALGCNFDYYVDKGDFKHAKEAFESYLSSKYEGNISDYPDAKSYVLYSKGKYYMFMNQLDSAYNNFHESLCSAKSYGNKAAVTKALAQYYARTNQPILGEQFALKSLEFQDSDFIETRNTQLQQVQALYDYSRHQEQATVAEKKVVQRTHMVYMLVIGGLIAFGIAFYFYRRNLILKEKKIEVQTILYEDCLLRLTNLQKELLKLKKEKDSASEKAFREKEEAFSKLKEEMGKIRDKYFNPLLTDTDIILKNTSIYKKLRYIEMHPKEKMEQEDWDELARTVEQIIPRFIPILKDVLNEKEYQVCLLVRLDFSVSFIGNLTGLSVPGVSAMRKRMLKKLCHKNGSPKEFDDFIHQLSEQKGDVKNV